MGLWYGKASCSCLIPMVVFVALSKLLVVSDGMALNANGTMVGFKESLWVLDMT